jgi:hypothetical protein
LIDTVSSTVINSTANASVTVVNTVEIWRKYVKPPRSKRLTASTLLSGLRLGNNLATSATAVSGPAVSCEAAMITSASFTSFPPQALAT